MLWKEFEQLAGYEVSLKDYIEIIEPMYLATGLCKAEFIRTLNRKAFEIRRAEKLTPVFLSDGTTTFNGCYYTGTWMMRVGELEADIRTGKTIVRLREMTPQEQQELRLSEGISHYVDIHTYDTDYLIKKPLSSWTA